MYIVCIIVIDNTCTCVMLRFNPHTHVDSMGVPSISPFPQYYSTPALGPHNPPQPHHPHSHTDTHGRPMVRAAWSEIKPDHGKNHFVKDTHSKSKSPPRKRIPSEKGKR